MAEGDGQDRLLPPLRLALRSVSYRRAFLFKMASLALAQARTVLRDLALRLRLVAARSQVSGLAGGAGRSLRGGRLPGPSCPPVLFLLQCAAARCCAPGRMKDLAPSALAWVRGLR